MKKTSVIKHSKKLVYTSLAAATLMGVGVGATTAITSVATPITANAVTTQSSQKQYSVDLHYDMVDSNGNSIKSCVSEPFNVYGKKSGRFYVTVPQIKGYKASNNNVMFLVSPVTGEAFQDEILFYTKIAPSSSVPADTPIKNSSNGGSSSSSQSTSQVSSESNPSTQQSSSTDSKTLAKENSSSETQPTKVTTSSSVSSSQQSSSKQDALVGNSSNNTSSSNKAMVAGSSQAVQAPTTAAATTSSSSKTTAKYATGDTLPQTGETHQGYLAVLGAFLLGMLGLTKVSRKHRA